MKFVGDLLIVILVLVPTYMLVSGYYTTGTINWWMFAAWLVIASFAVVITYIPHRKG